MYQKAKINERIRQFPQGAEWMEGREVKLLESFTEDGNTWWLVDMVTPFSGPNRFRFPEFVLDIPEVEKEVKVRENRSQEHIDTNFCKGFTKSGKPCKRKPVQGEEYCAIHLRSRA